MLPLLPGIIPFALIMGSVASNAGLIPFEAMGLNFIVFAGASQLMAIELLTKNTNSAVIILTGIAINLRFLLYSAALSPIFKDASLLSKIIGSYLFTDQSYAVSSSKDSEFKNNKQKLQFYFGNAVLMFIFWNFFVFLGVLFGNFAPKAISLDFAVPLSFMALTIPTLKTFKHKIIALVSTILSCLLYNLPLNLGLLTTAGICIGLAVFITREKK